MENQSPAVTAFLRDLRHPFKEVIGVLRSEILALDPGITEQIKWKAPSFGFAGTDRVTMNLRPTDRLQIVLHRGAKVRADVAGFQFADESGLVQWLARDRGTVSFASADDAEKKREDFLRLVDRWMRV
ncbi:DUF1801 domain-containing protein [Arthrobacter zhaoguopingii]|uniref:DUF1801 domain-containing protein n=1 Tax=Arthrobacter zhaoguopingii TaxID=2681491 RepID=UPI001916C3B1|nr:DUF1801 domain-containing protein [Arthrobacter zhaoguopingii]